MEKRTHLTSYLKINNSRYEKQKREAIRALMRFINTNGVNVKIALDAMAGKGIFTEYLLRINGLEKLILNDLAEDCYLHLQQKFHGKDKVKNICNQDFFSLDLNEKVDLVVVDFNNFTWNKKNQVTPFLDWVSRNQKNFSYLVYSDSFCYSLKFLKDKSKVNEKYQEYLNRVGKALSMKTITNIEYKNKNCSLLLLR